jgi:hypothetical protein
MSNEAAIISDLQELTKNEGAAETRVGRTRHRISLVEMWVGNRRVFLVQNTRSHTVSTEERIYTFAPRGAKHWQGRHGIARVKDLPKRNL